MLYKGYSIRVILLYYRAMCSIRVILLYYRAMCSIRVILLYYRAMCSIRVILLYYRAMCSIIGHIINNSVTVTACQGVAYRTTGHYN